MDFVKRNWGFEFESDFFRKWEEKVRNGEWIIVKWELGAQREHKRSLIDAYWLTLMN